VPPICNVPPLPAKVMAPPTIAPLNTANAPPLIVGLLITPPLKTHSLPPIIDPLAVPPLKTLSKPPLLTIVALARPPSSMIWYRHR
jgi:hypothetical protein